MSDEVEPDAVRREHARWMVETLTRDEIAQEIIRGYDEGERHLVRRHVLAFQLMGLGRSRGVTPDASSTPIGILRKALREWSGEWPPTQTAIAGPAGWKDERSVRQAIHGAKPPTTWLAELEAAKPSDR